ncbi:MAG: hypothetical protein ABI210_06650, partial [Abditibacteriaceae bacterium]
TVVSPLVEAVDGIISSAPIMLISPFPFVIDEGRVRNSGKTTDASLIKSCHLHLSRKYSRAG